MAGAMRKIGVYLGIVEDDERDYYDDDRYDDDRYDDDARYDERGRRDGRYDDARLGGREEVREGRGSSVATLSDRRSGATSAQAQAAHSGHGGGSAALAPAPAPVPAPTPQGSLDRITTIHPRAYNDAKTIGETFRAGTPVIMNVTDMDDPDAKRLVDFAAGLVFGLRGTLERVTNKVFLLSPANVTVTAEDKARMAQSGFFNQS